MKEKEKEVIWSRSNGSLFEKFAISLRNFPLSIFQIRSFLCLR